MVKKTRWAVTAIAFSGAIGGTLGVTSGSLLPPQQQAYAATPEEIIEWCENAATLDGEAQSFTGDSAPQAHSCDYEETSFTTVDGSVEKVSVDFPNCKPDITEALDVEIDWSMLVAQRPGTHAATKDATGPLGKVLNAAWTKHEGTLGLTVPEAPAGGKNKYDVPVGKVLHIEFTPQLNRMEGTWTVVKEEGGEPVTVPEVTEGPTVGTTADGPVVEGKVTPVYTDC